MISATRVKEPRSTWGHIDIVELDEDKTYLRSVASSSREIGGVDFPGLHDSLTVDWDCSMSVWAHLLGFMLQSSW